MICPVVFHLGLYGHGLGVLVSALFLSLTLLPAAFSRLGCCAVPHCSVLAG